MTNQKRKFSHCFLSCFRFMFLKIPNTFKFLFLNRFFDGFWFGKFEKITFFFYFSKNLPLAHRYPENHFDLCHKYTKPNKNQNDRNKNNNNKKKKSNKYTKVKT